MNKTFYEIIEARRSFYEINNDMVIEDEKLEEMLKRVVKTMPSAMNSQSSRVLLLIGKEHEKFWDITMEALKQRISEGKFDSTRIKIEKFAAGYGTILYLEEMDIIKELQDKYPTYKENFSIWSQQANGMLQFAVWTALEAEGYGASLQHYTELVEKQVREYWDLSPSWKLIAQMPFGKPINQPKEKSFEQIEKRVKVFK